MFLKELGKNFYVVTFVSIIFVGLVMGCGGSGATCVGKLAIDGKTFEGRDKNEDQARENVCTSYCIEGDTGYDRMYQDFIKTPNAKKVNIDFNSDKVPLKDKKWAAMSNEDLGRYIEQCRAGCMKLHNDGSRKIDVVCQ